VGPLFAVRDAIGRYTRGEPTVALSGSGPAELRAMVRTFNEMVDTLERQRRGQLGFLGGVVHDLRNPLTALRAGVATLRPDRPLPEEARLRKVVAMVDRQLARLDRMTGDLLETTRVVAGQLVLQLEDRDLRELVDDAVALFQPVSKDHRLAASLPGQPVPVRCDPTRIEQVLGNLLSNAIKYSPAGGQIQVSLTVRGGLAELLVSDQGVGLDASELTKIFDPFQRLGRPEAIPGTGLGLAVVKRIVEAHGGEVGVRSARGRGTTFWVQLPAASPPSWSRTPAAQANPAGASHRPH
jgi:signal transduction histidine kinase